MSGRSVEPNIATLPTLVPVRVANNVPADTARRLSRPGTRPNHWSIVEIMTGPTPEWYSNSPIRTNKGNGSKVKVAIDENMLTISCSIPVGPKKIRTPAMSTTRKASATGIPASIKEVTPPKIHKSINAQCTGHLKKASRKKLLVSRANWMVNNNVLIGIMLMIGADGGWSGVGRS